MKKVLHAHNVHCDATRADKCRVCLNTDVSCMRFVGDIS